MNAQQLQPTPTLRVAGLALALFACAALVSGCSQGFADAARVVNAEDGTLTIAKEDGLTEKTHEVAADADVILDGQPAALEELDSGDAVTLTTEEREGIEVVTKIEAKSKEQLEADKPAAHPLIEQPDQSLNDIPDTTSGFNDTYPQEPLPETDEPIDPEDGVPRQINDADVNVDDALAEESFSGKINSLGDDHFVMTDDSEVEHTFMVNDDTSYTLDGNEATFDDLIVGHSVNVTGEKDGDNYVATMVDATSGDSTE